MNKLARNFWFFFYFFTPALETGNFELSSQMHK